MKNKLIPLFALSALMLVGCAGGQTTSSSTITTKDITTTTSVTPTTLVSSTTSEAKSSPVTSEGWTNAINQVKTQNVIATGIATIIGSGSSTVTIKSTQNIVYLETKVDAYLSFTQREYYAKIDETTPSYLYYLSEDMDKPFWKRESTESEFLYSKSELFMFDLVYSNYTYDEQSGSYKNINPVSVYIDVNKSTLTFSNIVVKFVDGKLTSVDAHLLQTSPGGSAESDCIRTYKNHGEPLELTLPDVD